MSESLDSERIPNEHREFWNDAAPSWKQLFVGLDRAAQHVSDRLIELARIKEGDGLGYSHRFGCASCYGGTQNRGARACGRN